MSKLTQAAQRTREPATDFLLRCVKASLAEAREAHPVPYVDQHHMLGVMEEEMHELRQEVFRKRLDPAKFQSELLQIAAVAIRGIEDVTLRKSKK